MAASADPSRDAPGLAYVKMHGAGNDFIMIDGRQGLPAERLETLAALLCDRRRGLGADGIVVLYPAADGADFDMRYVNASGLPGEMCGNGARCAAFFAGEIGLAGRKAAFLTAAGRVRAEIEGTRVTLEIPPPAEIELGLELDLRGRIATVHKLMVGVPHAVTLVEDVARHPVAVEGPILSAHPAFGAGCNANFLEVQAGRLSMRTYERGVEAETLACGTGAVACAAVAFLLGRAGLRATIETRGGDCLDVALDHQAPAFRRAVLSGPTEVVARGRIDAGYLRRHGIL
jgi:diaminopimelate epimerase